MGELGERKWQFNRNSIARSIPNPIRENEKKMFLKKKNGPTGIRKKRSW